MSATGRRRRWLRRLFGGLVLLLVVGGTGAAWGIRELDRQLVERFPCRRWDIPSRIYSDSYVIHPGAELSAGLLVERLTLLDYRRTRRALRAPGEYRLDDGGLFVEIHARAFDYPDRRREPSIVRITFGDDRVRSIVELPEGIVRASFELEPEVLAGIFEQHWEERRVVRLSEVPSLLVKAVLAAEDRRFFQHHGIDPRAVARALVANLRSGRVVQGGSTLTQQLIKNFFLTEARTFRRKIIEAAMAILAERRFSKLDILETYLNEIYLGQRGPKGIFGVWEASQFYFGKEPRDLTIAETATLAGLIKAPGLYSPTRYPDRSRRRRNWVLRALEDLGEISTEDLVTALLEPLPDQLPTVERTRAPHFVDFVREEIEGRYPVEALTSQGFRIFTSIDPLLQEAAEDSIREGLESLERRFPELGEGKDRVEAALLAVIPPTGEIRAMVGGRSYRLSQFNRVTQAHRQPGSIFKPIVLLAAFEEEERRGAREWVSTTRVLDAPLKWKYDGGEWEPENYKGIYHGEVSIRRALELSLNSATARIAREIGIERIRDLAIRLGFSMDLPAYPSLVLGGVEVTPFEVAQAYAALANLGFRPELASIRAVLDSSGEALARNPMRAEQVVSPRVAYLVTDLMRGVLDHGSGRGVRAQGFGAPAAGKTGTTNDGRDAWFVGFVPGLLAVVWVGRDRGEPIGLTGAEAALPIWTRFMKNALRGQGTTEFLVPAGIEVVEIDPDTGQLATPRCPARLRESFFEGSGPIVSCDRHPVAPLEESDPS